MAELDLDGMLTKARLKADLLGVSECVQLGRFELVRSCGRGEQGTVYEAIDPLHGDRVALKHLHGVLASESVSLRDEFRALSGISHPNMAGLYELFCVDGWWFYTMELVCGMDFLSYVLGAGTRAAGHTCPDPSRIRAALMQLLDGVSALHAAGKVHRDLKPSNVLVEATGRVVIVDYGLVVDARSARSTRASKTPTHPHSKVAQGTAAYMAPEQRAGRAAKASADLYAVGIILREALAGGRAGSRKTSIALESQYDRVNCQGCRAAGPELAELRELCRGLIARDPARRPNADEALRRLGGRSTRWGVARYRARPSHDS
jgi:serine/threonine protein kinase